MKGLMILFLLQGIILSAYSEKPLKGGYWQNEEIYQEYDPSYSNDRFYIREIEGLRRPDFINGLDCSMVSRIEECGGRFYNFDREEQDFFSLIKENGINTVRVRLWNNYMSDIGVRGGGCLDRERVLGMALRANRAGLKFLLDFHYSDNWADPGKQACPKDWQGLNFAEAATALYRFTKETLEYMTEFGAVIDYVQIGNEINNGFMFPYGYIDWSSELSKSEGLDRVAELINVAAEAVRQTLPFCQIIIHTGDDALKTWYDESTHRNVPKGLWFFQQLQLRKVNYDIAAVSFYLFNHHTQGDYLDMRTITDSINQFSIQLNKPFIIMEYSTGFTLNPHRYAANSFDFQKSLLIRDEYPTSFQGQTNFILDIAEKVAQAYNGLGIFYWGGDWLPVKGAGWGDITTLASWSNQALFTYGGLATPSLAAIGSITNPYANKKN